MGDRIAVMNAGRIVQVDSPLAVYDRPADTFVGGFIGTPPMNFVAAEVVDERRRRPSRGSAAARSRSPTDARALAGRQVLLGIRAESIQVATAAERRVRSAPPSSSSSRSARTTCSRSRRATTC